MNINRSRLQLTCMSSNFQDPTNLFGRYISEPLKPGEAMVMGSSLRRTMLSDQAGYSIIGMRINEVNDQFTIRPGIREDILAICLNLKGVVFKGLPEKEFIARLKVQGPTIVTARHFEAVPYIEVVNPGHHIATITDWSVFELEVKVVWGRSNTLVENVDLQRSSPDKKNFINIDAVFNSVKKVNIEVQEFYGAFGLQEYLILDVWTNGSLTPSQAIRQAAATIIFWFSFVIAQEGKFFILNANDDDYFDDAEKNNDDWAASSKESKTELEENEKEETKELASATNKIHSLPIEELNLSVRSFNSLKQAQINVVGDLLQFSVSELKKIKNFGKVSLNEVLSVLAKYSLFLED